MKLSPTAFCDQLDTNDVVRADWMQMEKKFSGDRRDILAKLVTELKGEPTGKTTYQLARLLNYLLA